jgi:ribonuclease HI
MTAEEVAENTALLTKLRREADTHAPEPFSECEMLRAIKQAKVKSTAGADGISNALIQRCASSTIIRKAMLDSFNLCLSSASFPALLKQAKIRAIPKDNSGDYRPISLLSALGKIFEKMLEKRIREEMPLASNQFGCRPGHSTAQALARLVHASGLAAARGNSFGCISFDFSKAYDRVPCNLLLKKLDAANVSPYLILSVYDWLQGRTFFVSHRGARSNTLLLRNGIPQGSSLSVMLWLAFINDIPLNKDNTNLFVDDTMLWAQGPSNAAVSSKLKDQAIPLLQWCKTNKVKVNFSKTKLLFNVAQPGDDDIVHELGTIPKVSTLRYLGVTFKTNSIDSDSTFLLDLDSIGGDIRRRCSILRKIRQYHFPQRLMERFVNGFVCGKLRFFTPFLGAEIHDPTFLKPIELAYRELQRTETGAVRTTPIPLLQAATRRPSLINLIQTDTTNMIVSSIANSTLLGDEYRKWRGLYDGWTPLGTASNLLARTLPGIDSFVKKEPIPRNVQDGLFNCSFQIPTNRREALLLHLAGKLLQPSDIQLWIDGSFSRDGTGGAAYILTGQDIEETSEIIGLTQLTSPYEAELAALKIGLKALRAFTVAQSRIAIYTDCQGLARQLAALPFKYSHVESPILECSEAIHLLSQRNEIKLCWIPSHRGIGRSEEVDELARSGLTLDPVDPQPPMRISSVRLHIRREIRNRTENEIRTQVKPSNQVDYPERKFFTGFQTSVNGKVMWHKSPYTRKSCNDRGIMFRVRSGHTKCKAHFHQLGIIDSPSPCRLCKEEVAETVEHQLYHCSATQEALQNEIRELRQRSGQDQPNINTLCWTLPDAVQKLLHKAELIGAWI